MIPPTPAHPPTPKDVYYSIGASPTGNLKERIAELHGRDSLAAQAIPEVEQLLSTPAFRQTRWCRAFYRKVLSAMSILYPHANRAAEVRTPRREHAELADRRKRRRPRITRRSTRRALAPTRRGD
jgi:hypothetical protein